jgi:uncharacterized protein involved in exopolysaccharide biosynthesis
MSDSDWSRMLRYLDCLYRHRWLLLLMLALPFVLSLGVVARQARTYEATARLWVDASIEGDQVNYYLTPADVGSQTLNELLRTRAFCARVGRGSGLSTDLAAGHSLSDRTLDDLLFQTLSLQAGASVGGPNVVVVSFGYGKPEVAASTAQALVDAFKQEVLGGHVERVKSSVAFYQDQARKAQAELVDADRKLSDYLLGSADNALAAPGPLTAAPPREATAGDPPDPALAVLRREDDAARAHSDDLTKKFDQARLDLTMAQQSEPSGAKLIDRPLTPRDAVSKRKSLLAAALGGVVAGLLLTLLTLTVLTATDSSLRYAHEVEPAVGLRLVGSVPRIS